jgi:hypothetical protein
MKIKFTQSGGFAGLVRGCELSAADLSSRDRQELERLCAAAKLDRVKPTPAKGADRQYYEVTIEQGDGAIVDAKFDDSALTDAMVPLITFLRARSKPMPLK